MLKLTDYSLPELYSLFLRFCESKEVINLRQTCKSLRAKIPAFWELSELFIQFEQPLDYINRYRFLNRLSITFHKVQRLQITTKIEQLGDLTLVKLSELEEIKFDPKLKCVQRIFINYTKKLTQLEIPQTYLYLDMIYLSHLDISTFIIWPTWTRIQVIALVGIPRLKKIDIPVQCSRINYLNISQSGIREIYLYPLLKDSLIIQATEMINSPIIVYTHRENINYIQMTCTIVLKTI